MFEFTKAEKKLLHRLNTPAKIQDFLNGLNFNFELKSETFKSPLRVLREKNAHCLEGATLGAYILSLHGFSPLLLHLKTTRNDFEHVVAPFRINGLWGALSKTNHPVLRYRDSIYRSLRELVMSYFHEYYLENGVKTLRSYSRPLNLNVFKDNWTIANDDLWGIDEELDRIKHYNLMPPKAVKSLRRVEKIEILAGDREEYQRRFS